MTEKQEQQQKILQLGREMGWTETRALANITFINGHPVLYADGLTSILHEAGHKLTEVFSGDVEDGSYKAEVTLERFDTGTVITRSFSVAQAKRAGLWDDRPMVTGYTDGRSGAAIEVPNDNPWYKYPERMIWRRAIGWLVRDGCSDQLYGMQIKEELEDHYKSEAKAAAEKKKPSRLADKLANLKKSVEDETVPDKQLEESSQEAVESRPEFELPSDGDFKQRLEAFTEHYGRGGAEYGVNLREEAAEPEILFYKSVTYRVYRDIKLGYNHDEPDADYDRPAINDEGFFARFSLSMIEHVIDTDNSSPAKEDAIPLQGASKEAGKKTATESIPPTAPVAVTPPQDLSEASRQWLIDINEETTELRDIEKTWKRERKLPWYRELPQSEKDYLLAETRRIIKAIKAEAGA